MFYGCEHRHLRPVSPTFEGAGPPENLYALLSGIWCRYTCTPRLREKWRESNKTLGACSVTAFLAQEIYGGKVYGIPRPGGNFHCYNVIGGCVLDLTSEQFEGEILDYTDNPEQFREVHFLKEEKKRRYEYLREELLKKLAGKEACPDESRSGTKNRQRPV